MISPVHPFTFVQKIELMKKQIIAVVCLLAFSNFGYSQSEFLERQAEKAKNKVANRVENKIDEGMDKTLDKTEEGIEDSVKGSKKDKKGSKSKNAPKDQDEQNSENSSNDSISSSSSTNNQQAENSSSNSSNPKNSETSPELKAYSKFDFVPGEKVIGMEQFEETSIGDFPLGWNTNSSAELVKLGDSEEKWLSLLQDGYFMPEFVTDLPENFTLEFDVFTRYRSSNILSYGFDICAMPNPRKDVATEIYSATAGFEFLWTSCMDGAWYNVYEKGEVTSKNHNLSVAKLGCTGDDYEGYSKVHFSIWRQKNRLRIYVNESKVVDIPYALLIENKYNAFRFKTTYMNYSSSDIKDEVMVSSVRYAVGAPDTRSKLITEGKLVSRGILFDVNSDKIKPESYGTLKEIGTVLKENPTLKVQIIGHTDSDGDEAKNLELSKKRAASVKQSLVSEFGISADQLTTDGKGESQPSDPNTSAAGKANNRRVEFVKL